MKFEYSVTNVIRDKHPAKVNMLSPAREMPMLYESDTTRIILK
jgi:hypothetical protein